MNLTLSSHAAIRVQQRGIRESDIPVILDAGTPVDDESILLLSQDVDREIRKYKKAISTLERLRGCRVILAGQTVVTVYRATRRTQKRLLRGLYHHVAKPDSDEGNPNG
jgi:hypothetical protein